MASLGSEYEYFRDALARHTAGMNAETRQQAARSLFASFYAERLTLGATDDIVLWDEVDATPRSLFR